jgi:hypothetical protein
LSNKILSKILSLKNLEELHIDGIIYFVDEMTFEPFINLGYTLDKLKVLSIKERPEVVTDDGIIHIGKTCPNLHVFDIKYANQLTSIGFNNISKYYPNLKSLNLKLTNVTNQDVQMISQGCKNITDLILNNCSLLTPKVIEIVFGMFMKLDKLFLTEAFNDEPNKYDLIKTQSIVTEVCVSDNKGIDNTIIQYIVNCCPKLNRFNFTKCPNVQSKSIRFPDNLFIVL